MTRSIHPRAADFLNWLHAGCEGDIEVRTFEGSTPGPRIFISDTASAAYFGLKEDGAADVYYGVATRQPGSTTGTRDDLLHAPALWCDLDFKDLSGGRDEAIRRVEAFRPKPSGVVLSGGGVHLYWRLKEPLNMQEPADLTLLENLNRRIAAALGGDMNACDAARILRLPGTRNLKPDRGGARCIVDTMNGVTYNPSDFDHLPELPAAGANGKPLAAPVGDVIPDGARDTTLMSLAGSMRRRGMGEAEIMGALTITNQERCRPPVPEKDLQRIAHSVARYEPPATAAVTPEAAPPERPRIETLPLRDFLAIDDEPLQEHLDGRLAVFDRLQIAGPPKAGKSITCRALALSLATGQPWAGQPIAYTPCPTLWLDFEEGPSHLRRGFRRLWAGLRLDDAALHRAPLHVGSLTGFSLLADLDELSRLIRGEGIGAVFLDTLRRAMPPGKHQERDAEYGKQVALAVDYLRQQHAGNLLVGLLSHTTKARKVNDPVWTAVSGTGDLAASIDTLWELRGNLDAGVTIRTLRRHGPAPGPLALRLEADGAALRLVADAGTTTPETCATALEDVLAEAGREGIGREDLEAALRDRGLSQRQAKKTISEGVAAGFVVKGRVGMKVLHYATDVAPANVLEGAS